MSQNRFGVKKKFDSHNGIRTLKLNLKRLKQGFKTDSSPQNLRGYESVQAR